jgi:hypothetical protein
MESTSMKYMLFIEWFKSDLEVHQGDPSHLYDICRIMAIILIMWRKSKLIARDESGWSI